MKQIELSDEDYVLLEKFAARLDLTVPELLHGIADLSHAKTSSDALEALYEAHTKGTSWYLLRQN